MNRYDWKTANISSIFLLLTFLVLGCVADDRQVVSNANVKNNPLPKPQLNFKTFSEWCKNIERLNSDTQYTVEKLIKYAKTEDCLAAEQNLNSYKHFIFYDRGVKDITPLASIANIKSMHLRANKIVDLTPLSSLTNMTELDLRGVSKKEPLDLSPLKDLTQLEKLLLNGNNLQSTDALANLVNLKSLVLAGNELTDEDLIAIGKLEKLQALNLNSNYKIRDITPLKNLTQLESIGLEAVPISDLSPLSELKQLKTLVVTSYRLSDISSLAKLSQLEVLSLAFTNVTDISPLAHLTQLKILNLSFTKVSDLSALSSLQNLEEIYLKRVPIEPNSCPVKPDSICQFET